ncbi:ABC transporter family substrate-binding protein [Streptomyces beihaiensis]|uniref:ABC transporter family substrate-binding protein n=1 Tax=Streptomyces beihaiensis TaxID=2984495 RepID=A0ABT3TVG4_9ACTN|nr:ABC transporter family substrate-binding protein [Streptomyces beihaiensis]MCX3061023.1 ABC transporter family substrate-binding protein [Streptomyces beihaiensis]
MLPLAHRRPGPVARSAAFLVSGALAVTTLAGCGSDDDASRPAAGQDIAPAARAQLRDGGTLRWAVDAMPHTFNSFQADADATTDRITGAVLPSMFRIDANGRPKLDPDYLEKAEVVKTKPKQVVVYKLNQKAVWSDGREIGADDFAAQWRALSGHDTAYWTAHNAGYDRIEKIERGANNLEVRVTFAKPYADWRSLFSPLYPKSVMGKPDDFNEGARRTLKITAGPFTVAKVDRKADDITLKRNPRWWGRQAKLDQLVLVAVPRAQRPAALAAGKLDLADMGESGADRIALADRQKGASGPPAHGPAGLTPAQALRSWAIMHGDDEDAAAKEAAARKKARKAARTYAKEQHGLRGYVVRKSLEPAYTQLALNGTSGPLTDERVRRAVARAIDRRKLAQLVLKPLGLPVHTVGSHLALSGQAAYKDNSGALGKPDTAEARALLADAGWVAGGPVKDKDKDKSEAKEKEKDKEKGKKKGTDEAKAAAGSEGESADDGTYIVGEDDQKSGGVRTSGDDGKPRDDRKSADVMPALFGPGRVAAAQHAALLHQVDLVRGLRAGQPADKDKAGKRHSDARRQAAEDLKSDARHQVDQHLHKGAPAGAYAPKGTAAPAHAKDGARTAPLAKNGKPLTLRFVVPSGVGTEQLRAVADRITQMLAKVGIQTDLTKVADASYFKDHIANGDYDLALYSWPASAYPATDGRPIYAKPVPAADGSLTVEQNYTRVGTDRIDQLFDEAIGDLDQGDERSLIKQADARIWAAAGSIPLYQRPELVAARPNVANAGAFGFQQPEYEDIGFLKPGVKPSSSPSKK